jgi:hypothetical protein
MSILDILNELAADNSRLAKEAILKRESDNALLKQVIIATLNPYVNYFIKKIPAYTPSNITNSRLPDALTLLNDLSSRKVTGNAAAEHLAMTLSILNKDDAQVIERIIDRDLKCGVNESTVNKVYNNLLPTFDVMLSHKDISGIKYPAYAQTKMDGARGHLVWDGKNAVLWSRQGKQFKLGNVFDQTMFAMFGEKEMVTLDGELLFTDNDGNILDRKTSNGIANKANKGTISDDDTANAIFVCWDIVDFSGTLKYMLRWDSLRKIWREGYGHMNKVNIHLVNSCVVKSEEEAYEFYDLQIADGQEGAILKNMDAVWQPKRTKDLGKMKAEEEADLIVVGFNWGTGKFTGKMGSLICQTSDGKLEVNVSGFEDADRAQTDEWVGKIIAVTYNAVIKKKNSETYSLFLPRYAETRFDKKVANKFEELK